MRASSTARKRGSFGDIGTVAAGVKVGQLRRFETQAAAWAALNEPTGERRSRRNRVAFVLCANASAARSRRAEATRANRRAPAVDAMRDERSTDDNDAADDLLLSFAPSQAYLSALVARGDRRQLERTLLRGCSSGAGDVVEFLLAHGTDPNCVDEDGATALCVATAHRQGECVRLLVEAGADLEATDRNAGWSVSCPS